MSTLDGSIVNVAMPTFADPSIMPKGSFASATWVYVGFSLTSTAALLTGGRLGDLFGRRRIYIAGMLLFTLASLFCGISPDIHWLIASRVLQALGSAMLLSNGAALLVDAFPPHQRGKALGLFGMTVALGLSSGAPLGGLLLTSPERWPIIFLINLPVGVLGALLSMWALPKGQPSGTAKLDVRGAVLLAVFAGALGALIESFRHGYHPERAMGLAAAAVLAGFVLHRVERQAQEPIIDFELLSNRVFAGGSLALLFTFAALPASLLLIPYYLHDLGRVPMSSVGVVMLAGPLALSVCAPLAGSLSDRIGTRTLTVAGMVLAAFGYTLLAFGVSESPRPFDVAWRSFIVGMGMGFFTAPNSSAVMGATPRARLGLASGMLGTMRNLGAALGGAVSAVLFATSFLAATGAAYTADLARANPAATLGALRIAFLASAGFATLSALLSALPKSKTPLPAGGGS